MQVDNLYTTATSISVGETTNQYRDEYTGTISQIYSSEGSVSQEAYWLGWISYDNLPIYCQHNTVNEDENSITFVNDTVAQNYPIGYVYNGGSQLYNHVYMQNDAPFVTPANTCRFINNMHPEYSAQMVSSSFGNIQVGYNITIDGIYRVGSSVYGTDTGGLTGLLSWLNGETTRTLSFTFSGNTYTIDVDLSQMTDTYFLEIPTNEDSEIIVTFSLIQIIFSGNTRYKNGTSYSNTFISPSTRISHDNGDEPGNYNCFIGSWGSTAMVGFAAYYDRTGYVRYRDEYTTPLSYETRTGCTGTFLKEDITALPDNGVLYNNNIMAYRRIVSGNNRTYFVALLSPKDIITAISLFYRVYYNAENISANPSISSYVENISWATDVNESNEFLGVLKTGNITNSEFRNGLRTWQYTNIQYNDFTEDDIPEYNPEPGGGDDEESGSSIPIQRRLTMGAVSSFITCYGLTAAQVQEFGKKLWNSWVDNGGLVMAMVENFKFLIDSGIASNTGSIDISSVLDFIISLKVYPCDLRNLFAFSNNGNDGKIYIGRGTYGLEVSNTAIYKAINQLGYLDAGTYNVPRPFGDFRDYTNINITVYVPYCGTIELNPADVIGRQLSGTYVVDVMTGECTFFLEVYAVTDSGEHRYVVGTCDGQLGVTIPVSATNSGQIAARRFSDVAQFATTVGGFFNRNMQIGSDIAMQMATLGASGMASKNPDMASVQEHNIKMTGSQAYADNALGLLKDVTGQFGNSLTRAAIDAPSISGGSGIASFANPDCVWIQIRHGIYPTVNNYNHTVGKVSTKSAPLSSYSGFTVCHNVDVSGLSCTEEEKSAIKQLLETGVYL